MSLDRELAAAFGREAEMREIPPPDVEGLIRGGRARRRRRNVRRIGIASVAATVLVVVGAVVAAALLVPEPGRPDPVGPGQEDSSGVTQQTIPLTTYTRTVTDDEVLDAGFPRREVAELFGEAGRARVELVFRTRPDPGSGPQEGWALWFVDAQGERRIGDRGYYFYGDGERYDAAALVLVGMWTGGFHYVLSWEFEAGALVFEPVPEGPTRATTALLGDGIWERQGR